MADTIDAGRLIAVDGTRGKAADAAAEAVADALTERGIEVAISRFDASGLFGDLAAAPTSARHVSVRALTLVYAADLAFRLRWEIKPALEAGHVVIAAPYCDTAIAFGAGCGLREQWIADLLRFAPAPQLCARVVERKHRKGWKARFDRGYPEFCAAMLESTAPKLANAVARQKAIAWLEGRRRRAYRLTDKGLRLLADDVMDSRRAPARGSRARPRSERT